MDSGRPTPRRRPATAQKPLLKPLGPPLAPLPYVACATGAAAAGASRGFVKARLFLTL